MGSTKNSPIFQAGDPLCRCSFHYISMAFKNMGYYCEWVSFDYDCFYVLNTKGQSDNEHNFCQIIMLISDTIYSFCG